MLIPTGERLEHGLDVNVVGKEIVDSPYEAFELQQVSLPTHQTLVTQQTDDIKARADKVAIPTLSESRLRPPYPSTRTAPTPAPRRQRHDGQSDDLL